MHVVGLCIVGVLIAPPCAFGAVFYLDPDVTGGTHVGTQANPFQNIDAAAWTIINNALATDNVTIFCSARNAGSDTNQLWNNYLDVTRKTPAPAFTLAFDGHSQWNSNDTTPNWLPYTGPSRCQFQGVLSQSSAHTKFNNVTIDGVVMVQGGATAGFGGFLSICGDNWTIQNSDLSAAPRVTTGPGIILVPTADGAHEGTDGWCYPSSNIVIQDNVIHDTRGEALYMGGAGCSLTAAATDQNALRFDNGACQSNGPSGVTNALPAHQNITIQRNRIFNCGSRGGQGDCTDLKGGLYDVTIRQNDYTGNSVGTGSRCIVASGTTTDNTQNTNQNWVIEQNKIHDCVGDEDGGIAITQGWGTPNGITLRNNIIANVSVKACLRIYPTQALGVQLFTNTIYGCAAEAIKADPGALITMTNDALLNNNAGRNQVALGTITASFNAYSGTFGTACTSCLSGLTSAAFTNVASEDFTLPADSILIDEGTTIASFSNDYTGTQRPQGPAWDIGAYEFGTAHPAPSTFQNLRLLFLEGTLMSVGIAAVWLRAYCRRLAESSAMCTALIRRSLLQRAPQSRPLCRSERPGVPRPGTL